jgi:hypothetical protein
MKHIKEKINDTSQKRRTTKRIIPFENEGVLNPAAIKEGDLYIFFIEQVRKVFKHRVL